MDTRDFNKVRVSGRTIPRIYEAVWGASGTYVVIRYVDDTNTLIKSFLVDLSSYNEYEEYVFDGIFLEDNITSMTVVPETDTLYYIVKSDSGSSLRSYDMAKQKVATVFSSPLSEWLVQATSKDTIYLTSKASQNVPGYVYRITPSKNQFLSILGGKNGLTTLLSPDNRYILYSESTQGSFKTSLYDTKEGKDIRFPATVLPEKCVWTTAVKIYCATPKYVPTGTYPDSWYKGIIHFSDMLMTYEVDTDLTHYFTDPLQSAGEELELTQPTTNSGGVYILFTNKLNSNLWTYKIGIDDSVGE